MNVRQLLTQLSRVPTGVEVLIQIDGKVYRPTAAVAEPTGRPGRPNMVILAEAEAREEEQPKVVEPPNKPSPATAPPKPAPKKTAAPKKPAPKKG